MTLVERIGAVVAMNGRPMTTKQIAQKMRYPLKQIASHVSRAHNYGYIKVVETVTEVDRFYYRWGPTHEPQLRTDATPARAA